MIQLAPKSAGAIFPAPTMRVLNDTSPGFPLPAFTAKDVIKPFVAPTEPPPPLPPTIPNVTVVTLEKAPKRTVDQLGKSNIEILTGFAPDVPEVLGYVDFPSVSGSSDSTTAACFSLRVQSDALNLAQAERMIQTAVENELAVKDLIQSRASIGTFQSVTSINTFLNGISSQFDSLKQALEPRSAENRLTSAYISANNKLYISSSASPKQTPTAALDATKFIQSSDYTQNCTATKAFLLLCESAKRTSSPFIALLKKNLVNNSETATSFGAALNVTTNSLFDNFSTFVVNDIINMPAAKITQLIDDTSAAIKLIDSSLSKQTALSALLVTLSREYRLSLAGITQKMNTVFSLLEMPKPQNNYSAITDKIYGILSDSVVSNQVTGSCMNTIFDLIDSNRVLRYEDDYVSDFLPGQRAYFESLLGSSETVFSVAALDNLWRTTSRSANILQSWIPIVREPQPSESTFLSDKLTIASDFLQTLSAKLSVAQTTSPDPFAVIMRAAATNSTLAAAIFCYLLSRVTKSSETDGASSFIARDLAQTTPLSIASQAAIINAFFSDKTIIPQTYDYSFSKRDLVFALENPRGLLSSITQIFIEILNIFRNLEVNSKTIYSNATDSSILLILFMIMILITTNTVPSVVINTTQSVAYMMTVKPTRAAIVAAEIAELENAFIVTNIALHSFLTLVSSTSKAIVDALLNKESQQSLQLLLQAAGSSAQYIMTPEQLALIESVLADSISASKQTTQYVTDVSFLTKNTSEIVESVCSTVSGSVLIVGLPYGFMSTFGRKISLQQQFVNQINSDLVKINVFKRDLLRPSIIFESQSFSFDLSRFVVRDQSKHAQIDSSTITWSLIPTRRVGKRSSNIEFAKQANQPGSMLMSDRDYAQISQSVKDEIAKNHVVSYCLETLLKTAFDLDFDETTWTLQQTPQTFDTELVNILFETHVTRGVTQPAPPARSNIPVVPGKVVGITRSSIAPAPMPKGLTSVVTTKQAEVGAAATTVLTVIGEITSRLSDPFLISQQILTAKKFDRVFLLPIDQASFNIDVRASLNNGASQLEIDDAKSGDTNHLTTLFVSVESL
jgi:HAMP domain-containing protein